jgi:hypothetical protein
MPNLAVSFTDSVSIDTLLEGYCGITILHARHEVGNFLKSTLMKQAMLLGTYRFIGKDRG